MDRLIELKLTREECAVIMGALDRAPMQGVQTMAMVLNCFQKVQAAVQLAALAQTEAAPSAEPMAADGARA